MKQKGADDVLTQHSNAKFLTACLKPARRSKKDGRIHLGERFDGKDFRLEIVKLASAAMLQMNSVRVCQERNN